MLGAKWKWNNGSEEIKEERMGIASGEVARTSGILDEPRKRYGEDG